MLGGLYSPRVAGRNTLLFGGFWVPRFIFFEPLVLVVATFGVGSGLFGNLFSGLEQDVPQNDPSSTIRVFDCL